MIKIKTKATELEIIVEGQKIEGELTQNGWSYEIVSPISLQSVVESIWKVFKRGMYPGEEISVKLPGMRPVVVTSDDGDNVAELLIAIANKMFAKMTLELKATDVEFVVDGEKVCGKQTKDGWKYSMTSPIALKAIAEAVFDLFISRQYAVNGVVIKMPYLKPITVGKNEVESHIELLLLMARRMVVK